ncbi:MAG: NAD(P)/FAD-dependent oxidoreductase [Bacteroidota bacterium]|nr:NAD(P)/FAD-dependent oxidoreductase [Bacteroidota bacterium]
MKRIAIIGGGIAGLSLSIDLRQRGFDVVLIEKGSYPRHKVCGEYISMESRAYLESVCPVLSKLQLPVIDQFKLSSTGDISYSTKLDPGGFGISRYLLELMLYNQATELGVVVMLNCKASHFMLDEKSGNYTITTNAGAIQAALICNASGRKSNFETQARTVTSLGNTNYIGIKYHVTLDRNPKLIEIHNFPGGYCGISSIEDQQACLCYIVNSEALKNSGNSIPNLERSVLFQNKELKKLFHYAQFKTAHPLTISGINFLIKSPVSEDSIFVGDSAGSIAPITGNGMSIALRSASALAETIDYYFSKGLPTKQLMRSYSDFWNKEFSSRIKLSRYFQKLSEYPLLTNFTIRLMNSFPIIGRKIISQTHGQPF